ncbi:cupin domain-containing protein [Bifidobacterium sp.]|jgi:predicted cupin superfamily sugar epimerase|uniref:cupin domain-containing protein n=1 Tax=Bifidobacterium sp. TaxID=41200 RepID=UPI0025C183D1|nr:cupin domain-containing protein [Bifidobacterium sp.]MCH4208960.1 cupin domain-containing protein [Bifidobacterium sp.]MCI1224957.1 cupin domain-containing protein [Bifidobacterium sp.]
MSIPLDDMSAFARDAARRLGLEAHPEGGWYARDWQSPRTDSISERPLASLIYFLLPQGDASAWHKVDADEIWLWHGPAAVTLELGGNGDQPAADPALRTLITLGAGLSGTDADTQYAANVNAQDADGPAAAQTAPAASQATPTGHAIVPEGCWQRTLPGPGDALVSCVVSPGFVFEGFTLDQA